MATEIKIRIVLEPTEVEQAGRKAGVQFNRGFTSALNTNTEQFLQLQRRSDTALNSFQLNAIRQATELRRHYDQLGRAVEAAFRPDQRRALQAMQQFTVAAERQARGVGGGLGSSINAALDAARTKAQSTFAAIRSSAAGLLNFGGGGGGSGGGGILSGALSVFGGGALLGVVTSGLGAVAGGLKSVISTGVDFNATIESAGISLKRLLGSSAAATDEINKLKREALTAPVNFETLLELDQRLINVGFNARNTAKDLAEAATGVGLIAGTKGLDERFGRIITQLGQMATKGRTSNEELTTLAENNIPAYQLLATALGSTTKEVFKLAETGQLRGLETAELLLLQLAKAAREAGPEVQKSFAVLSSNLDDLTQQTAGAAAENIFGSLKKGLETITGPGAQGLAASVAAGVNNLTGPLTQGINAALDSLQSGRFFEIGSQITSGLKDGISATAQGAWDKAKELGEGVLSIVTNVLGIESPSRKMMELGLLSGEGYRLGLLSKKDEIQAALKQIVDVDAVIAGVKEQLGGKRRNISSKQEENLRAVLDTILQDATLNTKEINVALKQVAYLLATIKHETANTFEAIRERRADPNRQPGVAAQQARYFDTGFFGRGFVQLTHEDNYRRLGQRIGVGNQLVQNPDLALRPDIAAQIALTGSQEGLFRRDRQGRRYTLDRFINANRTDFFNARNIINGGNDKAGQIAGTASTFFDILSGSTRATAAAGTVDARQFAAATTEAQRFNRVLVDTAPVVTNINAQASLIPLNFDRISAELTPLPGELGRMANETARAAAATDDLDARIRKAAQAARQNPFAEEMEKLNRELASIGQNLEAKGALVQLQAIRDLAKADEDAVLNQIRSRVELADKTIYHSERSNDAVLSHLAQQTRGITEIVSDAKIGLIDTAFGLLDRGVQRITGRLGALRDVVGGILSSLLRLALNGAVMRLLGLSGSGSGSAQGNASAGSLSLPGLSGSGQGGGGLLNINNLLRTPSTFPALAAAGLNVPGLQSLFGINSGIQPGPSLSRIGDLPIVGNLPVPTLGGGGGQRGILAALGLQDLFKGFGLNNAQAGLTRGPLAAAAPLLGLSLGSSLGGSSLLGQILGGAGGLLVGVGATAAPAFLGSGAIASLFSNPFTIAAGVAALVGSFFFGRARQRAKDEEQSGLWLTDAINNIRQMRDAAKAGQLTDVAEARSLFETNIIGQFVSLINTLQTRSVRESRLTNQVRDLRALFDKEVVPEIRPAALAAARNRVNIIPEFHIGGVNPREQMARVLDNEMILTLRQQREVLALTGYNVFQAVGVPNAGQLGRDGLMQYHDGAQRVGLPQVSYNPAPYIGGNNAPAASNDNRPLHITLELDAQVVVGSEQAVRIVQVGARSSDGREAIIGVVNYGKQRRKF